MVTVGLIQELLFISESLKTTVSVAIGCKIINDKINIQIKDNFLEIWYLGNYIWRENLSDPVSMFGVESCDHISKIALGIDRNDLRWKDLCYFDK